MRSSSVLAEGTAKELKSKVGKDRFEIVFKDKKTLTAAVTLLGQGVVDTDEKENSLTMVLTDTNRDARGALDTLAKSKISIESMAVHKPSLDDVFLSLTGKQSAANIQEEE